MPYNHYLQVSEERYDLLCNRLNNFMAEVDDITKGPFQLFEPLSSQQIQELELIREVSKELQKKKEEDKKKVEEAALEDENAKNDKNQPTETEETDKTEKPKEVTAA